MTEKPFTGYNPAMKDRARKLRKNMTPQERHLWYDFLRGYPVKFYRQRSIDNFIVDFYCSRAHLAIEVDGSQHYTAGGLEYDRQRSAILRQYGVKVVRFSNSDIDREFGTVCAFIDKIIREELSKCQP